MQTLKFRYKPISGMLIAIIKIYQRVISPLIAPRLQI